MKKKFSRSGRYCSAIDGAVGANGTTTSLRNDYVAPDYKEHYLSHLAVNISSLDITEYDGITFFIKAEPAIRFKADISEINETWSIGSWNVPKNWMQVKVPFEQFRVHAQGSGNSIIELHALNRLSFGIQRSSALGSKPAPGEKGKVWIDEVRFYKNDDTSKIARL